MKKRTKLLSLLLVVLMLVSAVTPFAVFAADTETTTSGTVSHLTTLEAISSTGKLIPNGLVLYNTFDTWTKVSATQASSSTVDSYTNTNLTITNSVGNLGDGKNGTAELDGTDNKAIKITGLNTNPFYYIRVAQANTTEKIAADSEIASYIGQSFVYQFDYKQSAEGDVPFIIAQMYTRFTTGSEPGTPLLSVDDGYLKVREVNEETDKRVENYLTDANGNEISVVGDDYTTIAVLVNPQLNRFWVIVNGEVIGDEGYTFMRKAEMQTLKDPVTGETYPCDEENPVPYRYLHYDIRCGVGAKIDTYYENTMFYYVDQTYTCEDYLDILKPAGKKDVTDFTTREDVLATGKVVENGLILYNTFETWANTTTDRKEPSATDFDLYGNTDVGTWTKLMTGNGDSADLVDTDTDGNTALKVESNNGSPYYLLRINNAATKAVAGESTISSFIGQSFVYQMDYKPSTLEFGANVSLITFHTKAVSGSEDKVTTVRLTKDGYIQVINNGSFVDLKDTDGEQVRLTDNEFTTITLFVNPQINQYWVFINGEVTNEAGYTFLSKDNMKTLVVTASGNDGATTEEDTYLYNETTEKFLDKDGNDTDNPVPHKYMLYDVRCTLGGITAYLDNIQFYFVNQTYTYEDYLGMFDIVKGNTATLGSTIGYNYYLNLPANFLADNPDLMAKITVNGTTRRIKLADVTTVTDKDIDGDGNVDNWVKITCGLSAAEMARDITLTIAQGSTVFYHETASVKEYAESITVENGYTEEAEKAAKSMLVYGAYAQQYFGVDTDKPAIDVTGAELKDLPTEKMYGVVGERFNYISSTLALKSEVIICHYFDNVVGLTFTLDGKKLNAVADGNRLRVDITGIKAVDLDKVYSLVVSDEKNNSYTIKYSAVGYAQKASASDKADLVNLVKAMYTYNVYADAYADAYAGA